MSVARARLDRAAVSADPPRWPSRSPNTPLTASGGVAWSLGVVAPADDCVTRARLDRAAVEASPAAMSVAVPETPLTSY